MDILSPFISVLCQETMPVHTDHTRPGWTTSGLSVEEPWCGQLSDRGRLNNRTVPSQQNDQQH